MKSRLRLRVTTSAPFGNQLIYRVVNKDSPRSFAPTFWSNTPLEAAQQFVSTSPRERPCVLCSSPHVGFHATCDTCIGQGKLQ